MGDLDIRFYLSLLLRKLPWIVVIVVVFTAGGVAVALVLPPLYRATAKILVEAPQIPAEMARSTVPISAVQQFEIIEHEVVTTDSLAALAARQHVYEGTGDKMSVADIADDMRARISFEQVELNSPRDAGGATIFNVSFEAGNAELAARVVGDLVDSILSKNISLRTGKAGDTLQFFDQETKRLGTELTRLEADILKFKTANKEALPDSLDFRRAQQSSQQERLSQLEREEAALRSRRANLVEMFKNTGNIVAAGPLSPEQQMLQDMNRALADQLTVFQETSPNIVMLRARIETLRKRVNASHATNPSGGKAGPTELDFQLSDIDERLRFITQEKASITSNLEVLARTIGATPSNETILNSLERNRANIQAQYNNAIAMLAQASTGEQIELRSKGGRLSVVEPAVAPEKPYSPNRRRIAGAGLAAGIGASVGLVLLLELLNKTIRRPSELAALLNSEPLATIAYISNHTQGRNEVEQRSRGNFRGAVPASERAA